MSGIDIAGGVTNTRVVTLGDVDGDGDPDLVVGNADGSIVFEMTDAEVPKGWSQLATDIVVSKYFRKAGVPQLDENGQPRVAARPAGRSARGL